MIDLSIIIPAHNAEKFLDQCIESLIPKKSSKIASEIIIVENNSTDSTSEKCQKLAKKYKNITVLSCKKPGAPAARNFGLKKAKGKYIWFVDADDYVKPGTTEEILATARQTDADCVIIKAKKVTENGNKWPGQSVELFAIDPQKDQNWKQKFIQAGLAPWAIVFKNAFLTKNRLSFDEGIIHEDIALMSSLVLYTEKIALCQKSCYYYRQTQGSVLHQETWSEKEFDIFKALDLLLKRFEKAKMFDKYRDELEFFFIWNLLDDAARAFNRFKEGKPGYKKIRQTMRREFPHWRRNKYLRKKPILVRLRRYTAFYGIVW